ncbi:hypothetical protein C5167_005041 [Papaver somniferum]|uniref:Uncharacterized protein n=1 Tax=Papaver somniferum TaxID=3469 RepID=A0A4Y7J9C8_PAPSO|nr:hypothetical protein C5167_005041 [Papaver somniferum]
MLLYEEKEKLDAGVKAEIQFNIEQGIPIDSSVLFSELPPGYDLGYALMMEARYNWKNGKGIFEEAEQADARGFSVLKDMGFVSAVIDDWVSIVWID